MEKKQEFVAGLELPVGMRIIEKDGMIYFVTDDKRDLLTLHRKLEQASLAAAMEFYPEKENKK